MGRKARKEGNGKGDAHKSADEQGRMETSANSKWAGVESESAKLREVEGKKQM